MARPLKEGLDYFPMDTRFDEKIQALESVFKNDGLVWIIKFWQLAYRTNNGEVSLDGYHEVIHAENSRVTLEKQKEIIKLCLEIGLLTENKPNNYSSNGIKKRLEYVVRERERWRIKHKIGVISPIIHRENPEETGESKVKESKVKETIKALSCKQDLEAPILYLNEKAKRQFNPKNKANLDLVKARFNEGRTIEDFKKVIDKKVKAWFTDDKMMMYLRPETLFNRSKFESYLNEPEIAPQDEFKKKYQKERLL